MPIPGSAILGKVFRMMGHEQVLPKHDQSRNSADRKLSGYVGRSSTGDRIPQPSPPTEPVYSTANKNQVLLLVNDSSMERHMSHTRPRTEGLSPLSRQEIGDSVDVHTVILGMADTNQYTARKHPEKAN